MKTLQVFNYTRWRFAEKSKFFPLTMARAPLTGRRAVFKILFQTALTLELVPIPDEELSVERDIRDIKDRPILRAAMEAGAEVLLTGDKDFLESRVKTPRIMTPADFLRLD